MLPCWKSGTLTEATGDSSVQPYPSKGSMPNFALNSCAKDCGSFSAPTKRKRSDLKSSGSQRRTNERRNVGVERKIVAWNFLHTSPISFACSGLGQYTIEAPTWSGSHSVTV